MKLGIFSVIFFSSGIVFANCPDLSGQYVCRYKTQSFKSTWSQSVKSDVTTYSEIDESGLSQSFVTDGQERQTEVYQDGFLMKRAREATCAEGGLAYKDHTYLVNPEDGTPLGQIAIEMKVSRKDKGALTFKGSSWVEMDGQEKQTQAFEMKCVVH